MGRKTTDPETLGQCVRAGRIQHGLSLEDLALESGYTVGVMRDIEEDRIVPPVSLILQLSRILRLDVEDEADARATSHKKRVDSYAYKTLTKPGTDRHLRAYHVTIEAHTDHTGVEYHHEGEEFIYVLKGGLRIQVGDNISTLAKGESIHFNSSLHHKLSNPTHESTNLLVVIFVP